MPVFVCWCICAGFFKGLEVVSLRVKGERGKRGETNGHRAGIQNGDGMRVNQWKEIKARILMLVD